MLSGPAALFTLVRKLAAREPLTDVAAPKWLVQRHSLASLAARYGVAAYRPDLARSALDWTRISSELATLVDLMHRRDVRTAPIKGAAYATWLYDVPSERPMADFDLLVPHAQLKDARNVLRDRGYVRRAVPAFHHAEPWSRDDLVVDLHWNIIAWGRSGIDLNAVWARTAPSRPSGAERLEATDALVFHLVNMVRSRLRGPLIAVVDVARMLAAGADRDLALSRAAAWKVDRGAALALQFCDSILEDRPGLPAGRVGPTLEEVALLAAPSRSSKLVFDLFVAGAPEQILARTLGYVGSQFAARSRRA